MAIKGRLASSSIRPTTLLFDLDGTLVDMRRRGLEFRFVARAVLRFAGAIPPWRLKRAFTEAVRGLQTHRSERSNYDVFLDALSKNARVTREEMERRTRLLVSRDFARMSDCFLPVPEARNTLLLAKRLGYRVVLATNPVWPLEAVRMRAQWGGLENVSFDFISHSEIMTRSKPDPDYYRQLLGKIRASASECLMIGNDPRKDLPAHDVGIGTFLLERPGTPMPEDPRLDGFGTYHDLQPWLEERCPLNRSLSA